MLNKVKISLILFSGLLIAYFFVVPFVITKNIDFIKKNISEQTGLQLNIDNPQIKMLPYLAVSFQSDNLNIENSVHISKPKVTINFLPVLFKTISIREFYGENVNAKLRLDKDKNLFIGNYKVIKIDNDFKLKLKDFKIFNYEISFNDEFNNNSVALKGEEILLHQAKNIYLSTIGNVIINNSKSKANLDMDLAEDFSSFKIDGTITNLNLKSLAPYLKFASNNLVEDITGVINLEADSQKDKTLANIVSENFSLKIKDIEKPFVLKPKAIFNTQFNLAKNSLHIDYLKIKSDKINAEINGTIKDLTDKIPATDINLRLDNTRSEALLSLIPYMNFDMCELNLKKLRDYGIYSTVNGAINIKGKSLEPDLNGSFVATDVYVLRPLPIPKATIKLDFADKKVFFDAFTPASKTENVKVRGDVELYNDKIAHIDIESTKNVDLKTAQIILNPLHEILDFELGPVPIMDIKGVGNIKLKVVGNKEFPHLWGRFNFKNGIVKFDNVNAVIENGAGKLDFNDENMHFESTKAFLNSVPIKVDGTCTTQGVLSFNVTSNGQTLNNALKILKTSPMLQYLSNPVQPISAAAGKINLNINLRGKMKHLSEFEFGKTIIASGQIKLLNNDVIIGNSLLKLKNIIGNIKFDNDKIDFKLSPLISGQRVNLTGKIINNQIYSNNYFNNLKLNVMDSDILIKSGSVNINGDRITVNNLISEIESEPMTINGDIRNIYSNPKLDIYLTSSLTQGFINKYVNKNSISPLIAKGEIDYSTRVYGTLNALNLNGVINFKKGSSIYYKGASLIANENPLKLNIDLILTPNKYYLRNFQYNKIDNNKIINLLNANGGIKLDNNKKPVFDNVKIKTKNPTDAKIFNVLFQKPLIKEGLFTSDLIINGNLENPSAFGTFNIFGVNAPFLEATINDIGCVFRNKTTDIKVKGDILSNEINFSANVVNKLHPPYVINNADLYLGNFNINSFLAELDKINLEDFDRVHPVNGENVTSFDIKDLIIKKLNIRANSVNFRNLFANDLNADISLTNGLFRLENLNFVTAEGLIKGQMTYNLKNYKMESNLSIDKINANLISEALFDIKNQIYGDLSGETTIRCEGKTHKECMKSLTGDCKFAVINGKMPKLGSLEYLLKSSNIIKSGLTGLSLNNLIEILTPIKTGDFESIKGHFTIDGGRTPDINITSKGKDLSIFISGEYDFPTAIANLEIYGRLAKQATNKLGKLGNISLNTIIDSIPGIHLKSANKAEIVRIINKFPGIELDTNEYRIFFVKLDGNMETEDIHTVFRWLD